MRFKWSDVGLCALLWLVATACVRKPTLREVKQDPVYQRAAQAHQGLTGLSVPASCQGTRCRTLWTRQKAHFDQAHQSYHALIRRDNKQIGLSGVLARCRLADLHAERQALLRRLPEPSRQLIREQIVAKIRASLTKRGVAPGGQDQMLQKPKLKQGIAKNVAQWVAKRKAEIDSVARRSGLRARHHYKKCFRHAERHGELKSLRERARRFLEKTGGI